MDSPITAPPATVKVTVTQLSREHMLWLAIRQSLLMVVTAIEEYLAIPANRSALVARRTK